MMLSHPCEFAITTLCAPSVLNVCPPTVTLLPSQIVVSIVRDVVDRIDKFNVIVLSHPCAFEMTTVCVPGVLNVCPPIVTLLFEQMLVSIVRAVVDRTVKFNVMVLSHPSAFGITTVCV